MIPVWKLRRELSRVGAQITGLPRLLASMPSRLSEARRREEYERDFDQVTRLSDGAQPARDRIAIFLIFQPKGIAPSILETCRWLQSEGYAPFVVSNGFLDETARAQVMEESWRLLERPNFGYDFGGYRDGIRLLWRWNFAPERLIVMNDSVWLPMVPDLMDRLEAVARVADIVGLLRDEKVQHNVGGGQETERWHIESYFYLMTPAALTHPEFRAFWQEYRMTDFKPHTIKYGELNFSSRMISAGLCLEALTCRRTFLQRLAEQEDAFLLRTLHYASYSEKDRDIVLAATKLAGHDPTEAGWRDLVMQHIRRSVYRRRFNATFPYANDQLFGTLFMKKTSETVFAGMRDAYLRAIERGEVKPPSAVILSEVKARTRTNRTDCAPPPWSVK
jgi:Rhamnan synthesis protein F